MAQVQEGQVVVGSGTGELSTTTSSLSRGPKDSSMLWGGFARIKYDLPAVDLLGDHHTPAEDTAHPRLQAVLDFVALAGASPYGQEVNPTPAKKPLDPKAYARKKMVQIMNKMEDSIAPDTGGSKAASRKKRKQNQLQWRNSPTFGNSDR